MLKRAFDLLLSGLGLVLSFPLWLLISVLIKLEDRGPVFFNQQRAGRGGRSFVAYKFRSMKVGSHGTAQARQDDPRVTRVGRVLRATAMDELPQLLNIFLGDMSFVGPRALLLSEIEVHESRPEEETIVQELFRRRCEVTPGLTGIAQIYAPRDVPRRKKFRYDLLYVRRRSFCLDLRLIFLSFWITFMAKWESRQGKLQKTGRKGNA